MTDRIKRHLSGWRAAALPTVAVLALAVLIAACTPEEEAEALPPILLNDPPPPIHTGGEPYPPGTIPPDAVRTWEILTEDLSRPGAFWGSDGRHSCLFSVDGDGIGRVHNQWIFSYEEELEDPEAAIAEELRDAGWEFESITVLTADDYAQYDPETFYNWLAPDNHQFDPLASLERLGGELHVHAESATFVSNYNYRHGQGAHRYQVKLQRHPEGKVTELPHADGISFSIATLCNGGDRGYVFYHLVGGLYTTFGDDLVWDWPASVP